MQIQEIKNMRFLGQVEDIIIFDAGMGKWFLCVKASAFDDYVKLTTARGELRLFKTLDAANKTAVEILRVAPSHLLNEEQKSAPFVRIVN